MFTVSPTNITDGIVPDGTTYSWSAPSVTGNLTGGLAGSDLMITGTLANPTDTVQSATYIVTPVSGNCSGASFTVIVSVNPAGIITDMTSVSCSGVLFTVTPVDFVNGVVPFGTTYSWTAPTVTGGLTGGLSGTNQTDIFGTLTNPTNIVQTATYTVTPVTGTCIGTVFTVTMTINPTAVITDMTTVTCSGVMFTVTPVDGANGIVPAGTLYTWTAPTGIGFIGGAVQGAGVNTITGTLHNTTDIARTATYTVTPTTVNCGAAAPFTVTVTINPAGIITPMSLASCGGVTFTITPTDTINGVVPAGTLYSWSVPTGSGFMGGASQLTSISNITGNLTNTVNTAITATYLVTPITGICIGNTFSLTVTVNPVAFITDMSTTTCSGVTFSVIPVDGTNGIVPAGITYNWLAPTGTGFTGGAAINGSVDINGLLTNITSTAKTATYTVTPNLPGGCGIGIPFTLTVNLNPVPVITAMSTISCNSTTFTVLPVDITNGIVPAGTTYSWSAPAVTGGLSGGQAISGAANIYGSLYNPTIVTQTATYTVTPSTVDCGAAATFTVTVVINPEPMITAMTATTCSGVMFMVTPTDGLNGAVPANTMYRWSAPIVTGGVTGGAGATGQVNISGILSNPTNTAQMVSYTVTPSYAGCDGATFTVTVTLNPIAVITDMTTVTASGLAFAVSPVDMVNGIVPNGTTYTWPQPTITGGITGGAIGNNQANIYGLLMNPTNQIQTATYQVTPTTTNCGNNAQFTVTVQLDPVPTITDMATTICSGDTLGLSPVNGVNGIVPDGTTYTWSAPSFTGIVTGGTGITAATNIYGTLVNQTNTVQTVTYTVTPTSPAGYPGSPFSVTITIRPEAYIAPMSTTTCGGVAFSVTPTDIVNGILPAGTTFTWTAPTGTGFTGGVTQTTGVANIFGNINNTTNATVNATYLVTPQSGICTGAAFTVTVSLNPTPQITAIADPSCTGVTFNITPTNGTDGIVPIGTLYTWTAPTGIGFTGGAAQTTGVSPFTGNLINTTASPVTATYMVSPVAGNCAGATFTLTMTIGAVPNANIALCTQTVCLNVTPTQISVNATGGIGTLLYQWYQNGANSTSGGTAIVGANSVNFIPPAPATTNTVYYYATVGFSVGGCPTITTAGTSELIVNRYANAADLSIPPVIICSGLQATIFAALSSTSNITGPVYNWYNDANLTSQVGSGASFTTGILTNNTSLYVTVNGTNACANLPGTAKKVDISISSLAPSMVQPTDQVVCSGMTLTMPAFSSTNALSYNWVNSDATIGIPTLGTGNIPAFKALNNTINNDTAIIMVTPIANGCNGATQSFKIIVGPTPAAISNASVTVPSSIRMSYTPVGVPPGITYTWTTTIPYGITGSDIVNGAMHTSLDPLLTNSTLVPIDMPFTVIPYTGAPGYCAGTPFTVNVTVSPVPSVPDQVATTCSGVTLNVSPSGVPATTTFTWGIPTVLHGNGNINGINAQASPQTYFSQTLVNTGIDSAVLLYTVVPVNGSFTGNPFSITVTVYPNPVLTNTTPSAICNGTAFNYTPTSNTYGTTFNWSRAVVNGITNGTASGTGAVNEVLVNNSSDPVLVAYQYILTANGCNSSVPEQVYVTVNPSLGLTSVTSDVVCSNSLYNYIGTSVTGSVLTWTRAVVPGISNIAAASGSGSSGNEIHEVLNDTTNHPVDVRYLFRINSNSCTDTMSLVVTVNPLPTVDSVADLVFCNGVNPSIHFTGSIANTIYTWSNSNSNIGLITIGEGDIDFVANNATQFPIKSAVTVTPQLNGCTGAARRFNITVNPTPVLSTALNMPTVCSGLPVTYIPASATPGTTFTWTRSFVQGITSNLPDTGTSNINDTLFNSSNAPLQVNYTYVLTANGCANTQIVRVIINPLPKIANPGYQLACNNSTKVINFNGSTISGTNYSWTNDNTAIGIPQSGIGDIFFTATNSTTDSISANLKVIAKANGCTGDSTYFRVTVNPQLALGGTLTPAAICSNTPFVYTPFASAGETIFNWSRPAITGIANLPALGSGTINETLINTTTSPIQVTYLFTLYNNGCTNTQTVVVTVNPSLSLTNASIVNQACSNQPFSFTPISSITGVQYVWSRSAVNGIGNAPASGTGSINETLINNTTSPIDVAYQYSLGQGGSCSNNEVVHVTVKPTPYFTSLTNITNCSNIPVGYTPIANISGTSFNWSRSVVPGISNAAAVGLVGISESLINTTTAPITVNYAYTLSSSNGCSNAQTVSVLVNPAPVASYIGTQSVCAGTVVNPIVFSSNIPGTIFNWFNTEPGIGLNAFGTGNIPAFTATNAATGQLTGQIQVTPIANGCSGSTITVAKITVNNPLRASTVESSPTMACPNVSVGPFTGSIPLGGDGYNYNFQWQVSTDSINYINLPGAVSRQLTAPAITATSWYRLNTLSGGCSIFTPAVKIPLMPNPVITITNNDNNSVSIGNSTQVFATGGISYTWAPKNLTSDYTSPNPFLSPTVDTRFTVLVTNQEGCTDTAGITIKVTAGFAIYPNNIITPNGDGYNDVWVIKNIEYYPSNDIKIYNTNSQLVISFHNYTSTTNWNGSVGGTKLPSGTYYYIITLNPGGQIIKGYITILN